MKEDWLESGLNDQLGDYESPMDMEDAWNALQEKRQPEKKKRRFFLFWLSGLLLLVAGAGFFLLINPNWSSDTSSSISNVEKIETEANKMITQSNEEKLMVQRKVDQTVNVIANNESNFLNTNTNTNTNTNSPSELKTASAPIKKDNTADKASTSSTNASLAIASQKSKILLAEKNRAENFIQNVIKDRQNNQLNANDNIEGNNQNIELINIIQNSPSSQFRELEIPIVPIASITMLPLEYTAPQKTATQELFTVSRSPKAKAKLNLPQYLSLAGAISPFVQGKTFAYESPVDVISINFSFTKFLTPNLYVKTGIAFDQFLNKIEYTNITAEVGEFDDQLIAINRFLDGSVDNILGRAQAEVFQKTDYQIYNRYQFVSIPLMLGVELSPSGKSSFQIDGGVSASVFNRFDGKYLATNGPELFNELNTLDLKKSGLLNGLLGLQWNYAPFKNESLDFFLAYQGNFELNALSSSADLNVEKFNAHQIFLGLKFEVF